MDQWYGRTQTFTNLIDHWLTAQLIRDTDEAARVWKIISLLPPACMLTDVDFSAIMWPVLASAEKHVFQGQHTGHWPHKIRWESEGSCYLAKRWCMQPDLDNEDMLFHTSVQANGSGEISHFITHSAMPGKWVFFFRILRSPEMKRALDQGGQSNIGQRIHTRFQLFWRFELG